jgi:hypothetical protein
MSNLFNSQFRRGPPARAHHQGTTVSQSQRTAPHQPSCTPCRRTTPRGPPGFRHSKFGNQVDRSRAHTTSSSTAHSREREANSQRRHTRGSTLGHMSVCNEHNIIGRNKSFASASRRACPCGPMRAEREREKERESTALRRAFGPGAEGLSTGFTLSVSPQPDSPLSCPQAFVAAT